jgi:phosphatidate cytidylyltransferase
VFKSIVIRAISGVVYVALILGSIFLGSWAFAIVMGFAMLVSLGEFYNISKALGAKPQRILGFITAILIFLAGYAGAFGLFGGAVGKLWYAVIPASMVMFFAELSREQENPFTNIGYTILGLVYIAVPFALMSYVLQKGGQSIMFCFFILLWANDTFAFLLGIALGRHKLFPSISPKKSWEGYFGGIIFVVLAAYLMHLLFADVKLIHIVVIGLIVAVTGVFGDLVESMLKRSIGVKDSGKIMPGHGGLLDRFDAVLLSLPLVFAYVQVFM